MQSTVVLTDEQIKAATEAFSKMSIHDIDSFGDTELRQTQDGIDDILVNTKQYNVQSANDELVKLSKYAGKQTKRLTGNFVLASRVAKFIGRYENAEKQLGLLETGVNVQVQKLDGMLEGLEKNHEILQRQCDNLNCQLAEIEAYKDYLINEGNVDDEIRMQAVLKRVDKLKTFLGVANTSLDQTKMLIVQNKKYQYQLKDTMDVIIPVFKMQMIGALANRVNKETDDLINALKRAGNEIIVQNSKDIAESTIRLNNHKDGTIISKEALVEANKVLSEAVKQVQALSEDVLNEKDETASKLSEFRTVIDEYEAESKQEEAFRDAN